MIFKKVKVVTFILIGLVFTNICFAQNTSDESKKALENGIQLLQKYFLNEPAWHVTQSDIGKDVNGLVNFIQDEPVDDIIESLKTTTDKPFFEYVFRLPENVSDSLKVPGFYRAENVAADIEQMGVDLQKKYQENELTVPLELVSDIEKKVDVVEAGEGIRLFTDSVFVMPDSLIIPEVIPDSLLQSPEQFQQLLKTDSLRDDFIEKTRLAYNHSLVTAYRDSVIQDYRQRKFEEEYTFLQKKIKDSVALNNYQVLKNYNDQVVQAVNDSIANVVQVLSEYASFIDTAKINILNLSKDKGSITLQNGREHFTRVWLKNEQNDSLSVLVKNVDKRSIQMLIDDGVTFTRFTPKETKEFDFSTLNQSVSGLTKVGQTYKKETPWRLGGDGTVGFTQAHLENWKKGGKSALSLLMVLKGSANYSRADGKVKWENSGEIRNGWIRPGGEDSELQKNNDKFEITSRFGVSAFKRWYYSAELNYNTQFFNGYRYPTDKYPDPISSFMAPARTFFKVGLDYKPNKEFSLFISPLTLKNVYVRDTATIDQTKFGIEADKKSFWEPGLNMDLKFKKNLSPDLSYETKYKMFINYKSPFKKFDINWENQMTMRLTDHINMNMMLHLIYDDDVMFPVYDENDEKIGEKAKLQVKEMITVGFSYKINRQVMRSKRIRR